METLKPQILCHPNIPKPLHGIAPRVIKGNEWWDIARQEAYRRYDYHCVGCGVHKREAKKHQWLEAHEFWEIDYQTGICKINSIEPLCHYCHNFIHSGRLSMIMDKEKSRKEVIEILEHGFKILSENKLKTFPFTLQLANLIKAKTFNVQSYDLDENENLEWSDYKLIFEGREYSSKFDSKNEWQSFYSNADEKKTGTIHIANKHTHKPTKNDFYLGRGSCLGNPYSHIPSANAIGVQDRETAISLYGAWLKEKLSESNRNTPNSIAIRNLLNQIYIKVRNGEDVYLVCYCFPKPCHTEMIRDLILSKF